MADNIIGQTRVDVGLNLSKAERDFYAFESKLKSRPLKLNANNPFGSISKDADQFEASLKSAEARVLAFTSVTAQLFAFQRVMEEIARTTIAVDKSLRDINVVLGLSNSQLKQFSEQLFAVARLTGQSFDEVSKAAGEFARQGLTVEETLKRTRDAAILSRLALIDSVTATETLTATVNSFQKSLLTTTDVINKFSKVDQNFAVSSADLAEAISRVGSTAQDAGVSLDELIGLVTSTQQITSRGGAVIGNAFKTIFTKLNNPETLNYLDSLGVKVRDASGEALSASTILQNLGNAYAGLNSELRNSVVQQVGNIYQSNIVRAILSDLSKETSFYSLALQDSLNATDNAIQKNEELNKSYFALLNALQNNVKQTFANLGNLTVGPIFEDLAGYTNAVLESLNNTSSAEGFNKFGVNLGKSVIEGIGNFLTGPGAVLIAAALVKLSSIVVSFAGTAVKSLTNFKNLLEGENTGQTRILGIIERINAARLSGLNIEREKIALLQQEANLYTQLSSRGLVSRPVGRAGRNAANGFIPEESKMAEVALAQSGGYNAGQVKSLNVSGVGNIVYNTAEQVKKFPGFNQPAILPPKNSKAGRNYQKKFINKLGFDPYAAGGLVPSPRKAFGRNVGTLPSVIETAVQSDINRAIDQYLLQIKQGRESFESISNKSLQLGKQFDLTKASVKRLEQIFKYTQSGVNRAEQSFEVAQKSFAMQQTGSFNSVNQKEFNFNPTKLIQEELFTRPVPQRSIEEALGLSSPETKAQREYRQLQGGFDATERRTEQLAESLARKEKEKTTKRKERVLQTGRIFGIDPNQLSAEEREEYKKKNDAIRIQRKLQEKRAEEEKKNSQIIQTNLKQEQALQQKRIASQIAFDNKLQELTRAASNVGILGFGGKRELEKLQKIASGNSANAFAAQNALSQVVATRENRLQNRLLVGSLVAPIIGSVGQNVFSQETKAGRGGAEVSASLGNIGGFALAGASILGPKGALGGAALGTIMSLPSIIEAFTSEMPDLQRATEKLKEDTNQVTLALSTLVSATEKLSQIRRGETKATNAQVAQLEAEQLKQVQTINKFNPRLRGQTARLVESGDSEGLSNLSAQITLLQNQTTLVNDLKQSLVGALENNKLVRTFNRLGERNPLANAKEGLDLGFSFPPRLNDNQRILQETKLSTGLGNSTAFIIEELTKEGQDQAKTLRDFLLNLRGVNETGTPTSLETLLKSNPEFFNNLDQPENQRAFLARIGDFLNPADPGNRLTQELNELSKPNRISDLLLKSIFGDNFIEVINQDIKNRELAVATQRKIAAENKKFLDQIQNQLQDFNKALNDFSIQGIKELAGAERIENTRQSRFETEQKIAQLSGNESFANNSEFLIRNNQAQSSFRLQDLKLNRDFQTEILESAGQQIIEADKTINEFILTKFPNPNDTINRNSIEKKFTDLENTYGNLLSSIRFLVENPAEITEQGVTQISNSLTSALSKLRTERNTAPVGDAETLDKTIDIYQKLYVSFNTVLSNLEQKRATNLENLTTSLSASRDSLENSEQFLTARQSQELRKIRALRRFEVRSIRQTGASNLNAQRATNQSFDIKFISDAIGQAREETSLQKELRSIESTNKLSSFVNQQLGTLNPDEFKIEDLSGLEDEISRITDSLKGFEVLSNTMGQAGKDLLSPKIQVEKSRLNTLVNLRENINTEQAKLNAELENNSQLLDEQLKLTEKEIRLRRAFRENRFSEEQGVLTNQIAAGENFGDQFKKTVYEQISFTQADFFKSITDGTFDVINTMKGGFADAVSSIAKGTKTIEDAFRDLAINVASRIVDRTAEIGIDSLIGGLASASKSVFGAGKAKGGYISKFSEGGPVTGGSGVVDDVPAYLTKGEYVIRKDAVKKYGPKLLTALNERAVDVSLANRFDYITDTDPISGKSVIDENLSVFGALDENNPQNALRISREDNLNRYLQERKAYDENRRLAMRNFRKQMNSAMIGSFISAGIGLAGGALTQAFTPTPAVNTDGININDTFSAGDFNLSNTTPKLPTSDIGLSYTSRIGQTYSNSSFGLKNTYSPFATTNFDNINFRKSFQNFYPFANGGPVFGGTEMTDRVPARLMAGEFVMSKSAVEKYGPKFFDNLNNSRIGYAAGGLVGGYAGQNSSVSSTSIDMNPLMESINKLVSMLSNKEQKGNSYYTVNISNTIQKDGSTNTETSTTASDEEEQENLRKQATAIESAVLNIIRVQKRPNGELWGPTYYT